MQFGSRQTPRLASSATILAMLRASYAEASEKNETPRVARRTSTPLCCRPSKEESPNACNWSEILIDWRFSPAFGYRWGRSESCQKISEIGSLVVFCGTRWVFPLTSIPPPCAHQWHHLVAIVALGSVPYRHLCQHITRAGSRDRSSNYIGDEALLDDEILDIIWTIWTPAKSNHTISRDRID